MFNLNKKNRDRNKKKKKKRKQRSRKKIKRRVKGWEKNKDWEKINTNLPILPSLSLFFFSYLSSSTLLFVLVLLSLSSPLSPLHQPHSLHFLFHSHTLTLSLAFPFPFQSNRWATIRYVERRGQERGALLPRTATTGVVARAVEKEVREESRVEFVTEREGSIKEESESTMGRRKFLESGKT